MNVYSSFTYILTEQGENPYEGSEVCENRYSKDHYEMLPYFLHPPSVKRKLSSTDTILRATVDAPRYVTNDMIHKDLVIPTVQKVIHDRSVKHRTKLESHSNPLLQPLPLDNFIRRLKRRWPADL
jgi:hypothetical protein